ncbi:MAG: hypothetical protein K8J31_16350 [Anaerolineae bacterium]|nr:hypothetical protein [Anaerolineae bacterium]
MRQLVIEYVLEGHQRGYSFTASTEGYTDEELKLIWRSAMPRGHGWAQYVGARSLKCFPLGVQRRVVVCETTVTDMRDESDRGGIRRVVIEVMSRADYFAYLDQRLLNLPESARVQAERLPTFRQRLAISNSLMRHKKEQLVLLHPYHRPDDWRLIEGVVIKLALNPPGAMRRWGDVIPFTTLALNPQDELPLVALPASRKQAIDHKTPQLTV